jgi:hypothetical protein
MSATTENLLLEIQKLDDEYRDAQAQGKPASVIMALDIQRNRLKAQHLKLTEALTEGRRLLKD